MAGERTKLEMRFHTDPLQTRRRQEAELMERAMRDDMFKQELLSDPKGTLARELGVQFPDDLEIRVVEETPNIAYLVLPYTMTSEDLSTLKTMSEESHIAAGNTRKTAIQFTCCC